MQSALTGHFVLSSLHATDATAALHRFLDMGIESFLVASSVIAIVAQRLVRRICVGVQRAVHAARRRARVSTSSGAGSPRTTFFHGAGCNFCAHTGYSERIGVYELLRATDEIKQLIVRQRVRTTSFGHWRSQQGMRTLRDEALRLIDEDVTTVSEVLRSIYVV